MTEHLLPALATICNCWILFYITYCFHPNTHRGFKKCEEQVAGWYVFGSVLLVWLPQCCTRCMKWSMSTTFLLKLFETLTELRSCKNKTYTRSRRTCTVCCPPETWHSCRTLLLNAMPLCFICRHPAAQIVTMPTGKMQSILKGYKRQGYKADRNTNKMCSSFGSISRWTE